MGRATSFLILATLFFVVAAAATATGPKMPDPGKSSTEPIRYLKIVGEDPGDSLPDDPEIDWPE